MTTHVYDSPSGRHLLIPQGTRLLGEYDSRIAFGQSRLLLAWTRMILPNGRSIVLERDPGTDQAGYAGLSDRVNHHWGRLFLAAGLATVLGIGAELGADSDDPIASAIREAGQDTVGRTGDEIVRRQLAVPPTLASAPDPRCWSWSPAISCSSLQELTHGQAKLGRSKTTGRSS